MQETTLAYSTPPGVITGAIEQVGLQQVVEVGTDSAANCKTAWQIINRQYPHIMCSPCAAHCLDLLLEDWGKLSIASVIPEIADIVTFVKGREGSRAMLRNHSPKEVYSYPLKRVLE